MAKKHTKTVTKPSVWPIYIGAAVFVLCAVIFPMYKLWGILVGAALAVAAFIGANKLIPGETVEVEEPVRKSGDAAADELIELGGAAVNKLRALNQEIEDPLLTAQINRMEIACEAIFDAISQKPGKAGQVRRFMNYYLPTSIKLLESYTRLDDISTGHENVESTKLKIRSSMGMIADAFEKQLDNLYADEALDITTDIEVMESVLKGEGLK